MTNRGPDATGDAGLSCHLTGSHRLVAATASQGTSFRGTTSTGSLILCDLGTLHAGEKATVVVEVESGRDTLDLDAWAAGGEVDPDTIDNRVVESIRLAPEDAGPAAHRWTLLQAGRAGGAFFDLANCCQLAGWANDGKVTGPAVHAGSETEVFAMAQGFGIAMGVNGRGWLAGQVMLESGPRAFVRPAGAGAILLSTLGGRLGTAYKLDETSRWAAGMSTAGPEPLAPWLPALWTIQEEGGEVYADVVELPQVGGTGGMAIDVNSSGTVVGSAAARDGQYHAVIWRPYTGGEYDVLDLGLGAAAAVSDTGVVGGTLKDAAGIDRAFFHLAGTTRLVAGDVTCEGCPSHVAAVNNRGQVIGWIDGPGGRPLPALWDIRHAERGPVLLDRAIEPEMRSTVAFRAPQAINDAGQILVLGTYRGEPRNFLLTPAGAADPDWNQNLVPDACEADAAFFRRGDANNDGELDMADGIRSLGSLFLGGEPSGCLDAADTNDDGQLDISDPIGLLGYLFLGGSAPPHPHGGCGIDLTADALGCADPRLCSASLRDEAETSPCPGGRLLVIQAVWECRDGFWAHVTYEWYECPPDRRVQIVEKSVERTQDPCGGSLVLVPVPCPCPIFGHGHVFFSR